MPLSVNKVQAVNLIKQQLEHLLNSVTYFRHQKSCDDLREDQRQLDELIEQVLEPKEDDYIDYYQIHQQLRDGVLDLAINKAAEKPSNF